MEMKYNGTELEFFENAHNWKNYWFEFIQPYTGLNILDVGAGIGATATMFSSQNIDSYLAIEPDEENIQEIKIRQATGCFNKSFSCLEGCVTALSEDDLFDTILYIDVLEHINSDKNELKQAARHLQPGGRIIILSPAHEFLFSPFDRSIGHFRRYNKKSILLTKPDQFIVERLCYLDSVGVFASAANRLLLQSKYPTQKQINIWDNYMIPASRYIDRITGFYFGKSIIAVFQCPMKNVHE